MSKWIEIFDNGSIILQDDSKSDQIKITGNIVEKVPVTPENIKKYFGDLEESEIVI